MKRIFTAALFTATAFLASGTSAWACNQVTATITDGSNPAAPVEYASGGWMMVVDKNPMAVMGRVSNESGGQFSVVVPGNIGDAKVIISLYRPEGSAAVEPITRNVSFTGTAIGNPCSHITVTVDSPIFTTMRHGGIYTF